MSGFRDPNTSYVQYTISPEVLGMYATERDIAIVNKELVRLLRGRNVRIVMTDEYSYGEPPAGDDILQGIIQDAIVNLYMYYRDDEEVSNQ